MRFLLAIVILAGLGWSGFWWWNAAARERAATDWLAERRAAGWLAEADTVRVTGFPNRLDLMVEGLALADPDAGWRWSAEAFQVLSMTWKPHHFIVVWPGEQIVATPQEAITIESALMRGSVVFAPSPRMALDRASIEIEDMAIRGETGWEAGIGSAILATRQAEGGGAHAYDVALDAAAVRLPEAWTERVERAEVLPRVIEAAEIDATATFDRDWDRAAVESDNPALEALALRDVSLQWGRLDLRGRGDLTADAAGRAEGEVTLRVRNWREMLAAAEGAGALPAALVGPLRTGLDLLATFSGDKSSLTVPLRFDDGATRLGPVAIGDAPRLTRRR